MANFLAQDLYAFIFEQSYNIGMSFFLYLWPLVETHMDKEQDDMFSIFFIDICSYDESCTE